MLLTPNRLFKSSYRFSISSAKSLPYKAFLGTFFTTLLSVLLTTLFLVQVESAELYNYNQTVRSLGMGGVRVNDSSDASILLNNPAGLGAVKGIQWSVIGLGAGINGLQIASDLSSMGNVNGLSSMSSLYGKNIWVGAEGYSSLVLPYFGFAAYDSGFGNLRLTNPAFPQFNGKYYNDYGFIMGFALPLAPNAYFGSSFKRVDRTGGNIQISSDQLLNVQNSTIMNSLNNEGVGWGFDTGLYFQAPAPFSPTLGLSWKDLGYTSFTNTKGTESLDVIKDNLSLSVLFHGEVPLLGVAGGVEYRNISNNTEPLGKKIHLGMELSIALFDIRAGFYQGYTTYGLGLDLFIMQFDIASYTVEKGAYPGQTPDQRIQAGLTMAMGFDPNFKFLDGGGRKRKLKQRR